ncbi:MAG: hypothetical protein FWG55_05905 [Candidatus Bathyarchaeota archaeon]|nr:hypothetical protein [Candidatus Termiticorpusculum sp.]
MIPYYDGLPRYGQVDVEVRALIGFVDYVPNYMPPLFAAHYEFSGVEGDWSNTVMVTFNPLTFTTLPPSNTSPTNAPNQLTPYPTNQLTPNPTTPPTPDSQPTPWPSNLLIIIATTCLITIPIVVTKQALSRKSR